MWSSNMDGLERIKTLATDIKDNALLKIIQYLLSREDMNEKYLNEEKSLRQMIEFIKAEARKHSKDGIAIIEDEVVYGWAVHYFDESNKNLKLSESKNKDNKSTIKKIKETKKEEIKSKNWISEGQLTLFDFQ